VYCLRRSHVQPPAHMEAEAVTDPLIARLRRIADYVDALAPGNEPAEQVREAADAIERAEAVLAKWEKEPQPSFFQAPFHEVRAALRGK
jgi:hypothetical protein